MTSQLKTARDVSEFLLHRSGEAMSIGDFDTFESCFSVPYEVHTFEGLKVLENLDDMREVFDNVRSFHDRKGVTDVIRHCIEAEFREPSEIHAVHESRLVSGVTLIQNPYPVFSIIRRIEEQWKVVRSDYAVHDSPELAAALGCSSAVENALKQK